MSSDYEFGKLKNLSLIKCIGVIVLLEKKGIQKGIRKNVDSIKAGRTVIAHLFPEVIKRIVARRAFPIVVEKILLLLLY